jgi:putative phosphoesterase
MLIGVISDTHGCVPAAVRDVFAGVERIIHAGDVGTSLVLDELGTIAPVTAVCGNVDPECLDMTLDPLANVAFAGTRVLVVHRSADVPRPLPVGVGVVVFGHTHVALVEHRSGVLWLNPGSPARARSGSGHSVALLEIEGGAAQARIVRL